MGKILLTFIGVLLCCGCGRGTVSGPDQPQHSTQAPGVLISGFDEEPCVLAGANVIRVGWYYDFSAYDSLKISFNASRLSTEAPFDAIVVKIGPGTFLRDTVYAAQESISFSLRVSDLGKPANCAVTFRAPDPYSVLRLSGLRVVGWTAM